MTSLPIEITAYTPADQRSALEISNRCEPDYPESLEEWEHRERTRDPRCPSHRWVARLGDQVVGWCQFSRMEHAFHPQKLSVDVFVDPDHRRRGIGTNLFQRLLEEAEAIYQPIVLSTWAREDRPHSLGFLARQAFVEERREWESRLDPNSIRPEAWTEQTRRFHESGLTITTAAELMQLPDGNRRMWELANKVHRDVPSSDEPTDLDFDVWLGRRSSPGRLPDASFYAMDGDRLVGISTLSKPLVGDYLDTGLTGVLPEYRRRAVAITLKLQAVEYARRVGAPEIRTWNDQTNVGMLAINNQLGFVRQPAWIQFRREVKRA